MSMDVNKGIVGPRWENFCGVQRGGIVLERLETWLFWGRIAIQQAEWLPKNDGGERHIASHWFNN